MGLGKTYSTQYLLDSNNSSGVAGQVLSTTSTGIDWVDANTVPGTGLWLANGNDIYNSNSGNVGINSTDPGTKLEVKTDTNNDGITLEGSSSNLRFNIKNNSVTSGQRAFSMMMSGSYPALIYQALDNSYGFTRNIMAIEHSGNVGIGTISPTEKLEVNGNIRLGNSPSLLWGSNNLTLKTASSSTIGVFSLAPNSDGTVYAPRFQMLNASQVVGVSIRTDADSYFNGGNVGIGTTGPGSKLSIDSVSQDALAMNSSDGDGPYAVWRRQGASIGFVGNANALSVSGNTNFGVRATNDLVFAAGGASEKMRITSGGSVLVNTTSEQYISSGRGVIEINGDTGASKGSLLGLKVGNTHGGYILADSTQMQVYNHLATPLRFFTNANERMLIDSAGAIKFNAYNSTNNTGTPTYLLGTDASGNVVKTLSSAAPGSLWAASGNDIYNTNSANVGIGITNPTSLLHIDPSAAVETEVKIVGGGSSGQRYTGPWLSLTRKGPYDDYGIKYYTESTLNWFVGVPYQGGSGNSYQKFIIGTSATAGTGTVATFDYQGNVGIGTTSPDALLDIGVNNIITLDDTGSSTGFIGLGSYNDGTKNRAQGASYYGFGIEVDRPSQIMSMKSYDSNGAISGSNITLNRSGNVGIGTTSPQVRLTLRRENDGSLFELNRPASGVEALYGGIVGNDPYFYSNNGIFTLGINNPDGGLGGEVSYITMRNGTTRYTTFEAGNVGIGTTSPGSKLTISGGNNTDSEIRLINTSPTTDNDWFITPNYNDQSLRFRTNGAATTVLTMLDSGNVGIGTTGPTEKLQVEGKVYIQGNGQDWNETAPGPTRGSVHFDPGTTTADTGNALTFGASDTPGSPNEGSTAQAGIYTRTDGAYGSKMYFATTDSYVVGSKTRMMIDYNGNVGIGTTSPERKLHVFAGESNGAASNTQSTLVLENSTNTYLQFLTPASSESGILFGDTDNDRGALVYNHSTDAMNFTIAATTKMYINSSGNVGIGTTLPQSKLQANGGDGLTVTANDTAYSNGYFGRIQSDYGTNPLRLVSRSGDVFRATAFGAAVSILTGPTSGTSEKLRITSAGGVSFGSTGTAYGTSGQILKSNGNASPTWIDGSAIPGVPGGSGTLNTIPLWTPDGDTLGNSVMTQSGANIGIGTTSYTNSSGYSTLNINGTSGGQIAFQTAGASKHFIWGTATEFNIYNGEAGNLILYTAAAERMRINSSGDVLMGNTVVNPASNFSNQKGFGYKFSTGQTEIATTSDVSALTLGRNLSADGSILELRKESTIIGLFGSNTTGGQPLLDISANTTNGNMRFLTAGSERMRITSAGNVGIGTDDPGALLHLVGTTPELRIATAADGQTARLGLYEDAAGTHHGGYIQYVGGGDTLSLGIVNSTVNTDVITIKDNFNVGIGTTSPAHTLDVRGPDTDNAIIARFYSSEGSRGDFIIRNGSSTAPTTYIGTGGGSEELSIGTEDTNAIYIDNQQRVGIGTTGPGQKLDVSGNIASNSIYLYDSTSNDRLVLDLDGSDNLQISTGTSTGSRGITFFTENSEKMRILSGGNVGIGMTNPAVPLDVEGKIRSTNDNSGSYLEMFNDGDVSGNSFIKSTSGELIIESANDITFSPNSSEKMRITSTGDIELAASSRIVLDDQPTASTASGSGTIVKWSVSESTTAGTLYAVKSNGGWTTTDADIELRSIGMLGIALGSNATAGMLLQGFFYKSAHGFTIGLPLYISNTPGAFSTTRPTGANDYVRIIGYATSANYIYFDPDKTWVQVA